VRRLNSQAKSALKDIQSKGQTAYLDGISSLRKRGLVIAVENGQFRITPQGVEALIKETKK